MPYFIILPAYLALLFTLTVVAVSLRFVPCLQAASGYIIAGAVGTLPGFLAANAAIWLVALLPIWIDRESALMWAQWVHNASRLFTAVVLLLDRLLPPVLAFFSDLPQELA